MGTRVAAVRIAAPGILSGNAGRAWIARVGRIARLPSRTARACFPARGSVQVLVLPALGKIVNRVRQIRMFRAFFAAHFPNLIHVAPALAIFAVIGTVDCFRITSHFAGRTRLAQGLLLLIGVLSQRTHLTQRAHRRARGLILTCWALCAECFCISKLRAGTAKLALCLRGGILILTFVARRATLCTIRCAAISFGARLA